MIVYQLLASDFIFSRLIWGVSQVFVGSYAITENLNIPLIIQPQLFGFLSLVSWGQVDALCMADIRPV